MSESERVTGTVQVRYLVEVKVLVEKDHKDPLEVGDSEPVETCSIVPESVPNIGEGGDNEMENGHSCEAGREGREAVRSERWYERGREAVRSERW